MTRSNIVYAMSIVSRYAKSFEPQHIKTINRILKYVKESIDLSIVYLRKNSQKDFRNDFRNDFSNDFCFQEYCHLDHDEVINDRRSTIE